MPTVRPDPGARAPQPEAWTHLEALFTASYRKEIDQEENVWRSLTFFSAIVAAILVFLAQIADKVRALRGPWLWISATPCAAIVGLVALSLVYLFVSIRRRDFVYVSDEPVLLDWLRRLDGEHADGTADPWDDGRLAAELRRALIDQLAAATANNRSLNQASAEARAKAGRLLVISLGVTLALAALTLSLQVSGV